MTVPTLAQALEPFARVYLLNKQLSAEWKDDKPNSEFCPRVWPTWGDFRRAAEALAAHQSQAGGEDVRDVICAAFIAGAEAVQENFQPEMNPDFTEAAWDYAASIIFPSPISGEVAGAVGRLAERVATGILPDQDRVDIALLISAVGQDHTPSVAGVQAVADAPTDWWRPAGKTRKVGLVSWADAPLDQTLWGVYGPDCFPTMFACRMNAATGMRALWGYSIFRRVGKFRTLGVDEDWGTKNRLRLFLSSDDAFTHIESLFPPSSPSRS